MSTTREFGRIRSNIWPIHSFEVKKLVPMLVMLTLICFNYSILRNLKDALVITAKNSGAEVLPFIKVWVILPAAVLSTMLFTYLSNKLSRSAVFQIILVSFLIFFFVFGFIIFPMREQLHPHAMADFLETVLPKGFMGLIAMFRHWTLTCFYVVCELWSTMILNVLFWSFANEITRIQEAPRFYSVMSIFSNIAAIVAGQTAIALSSEVFDPTLSFGHDAWEQSLMKIMALIVASGIGVLLAFRWMNKHVLSNPKYLPKDAQEKVKKKEKKLSFRQSLVYLANSNYLIWIATLVISYNLVINLVEVIWKDQLRQYCTSSHDYNVYINNLTSIMGIISTSASLVMAGMIRRFGWTFTALITPVVLLITTAGFFSCLFFDGSLGPILTMFFGITPLALAVFLGSTQNCFSKAAKYSVFDATKEMAFVPLTPEHKLKGKAAIDGIGSRLGKSGGSVIHQGLLIFFGTLSASAPYVGIILVGVMFVWIAAVRSLGTEFTKCLTGDQKHPDGEPELTPA